MTDYDKLAHIKQLLTDGGTLPSDDKLISYLALAKHEILNWMYSQVGGIPTGITDVPAKYEATQVYAVIAGYTHAGSEGEMRHNENGINRIFSSADMLDYIHRNVIPYARVGAVITS